MIPLLIAEFPSTNKFIEIDRLRIPELFINSLAVTIY